MTKANNVRPIWGLEGLRQESAQHELNHKHYQKMARLHARIAARFAWAAFKAWCCK